MSKAPVKITTRNLRAAIGANKKLGYQLIDELMEGKIDFRKFVEDMMKIPGVAAASFYGQSKVSQHG